MEMRAKEKRREEEIINKAVRHVKEVLGGEESGHDWWHSYRVWRLALKIAEKENANKFVIQLAALLHDLGDWKLHGKDLGSKPAREWMEKQGISKDVIDKVCYIIDNLSFRGTGKKKMKTKEGKIVQDADRLDALGAIGIARCFATGSKLGKEIYNPEIKPKRFKNFRQFRNAKSTSINHFYEKLLLLKDLMNTETAKKIAEKRHRFMEKFLERFFKEWEGKA